MDQNKFWLEQLNDPAFLLEKQLRTPLSQIFSILHHLRSERNDDPQLIRQLSAINGASYRMLRTSVNFSCDNLLQNRQFPFQPKAGDLCDFFQKLGEDIKEYLSSAGIGFSYHIPQESVVCRFDENILSRVLMNLLSNACAAGPKESSEIVFRLEIGQQQAVFSLSDNGCGMDSNTLSHAFDRFWSYDLVTGVPRGDGLGLYLCRQLMQLHGGSVVLQSKPGHGTVAAVSFPLDRGGCDGSFHCCARRLSEDSFSDLYVLLSNVIDPEF